MKISIIGGGYVGLVTGACLASCGHTVTIIDCDPERVLSINQKRPPIFEEGLLELLVEHVGVHLHASTEYTPVRDSDLVLICVGTPQGEDGSADLSYISSAAEAVGQVIRDSDRFIVVGVKSTVPPGTTLNLVRPAVIAASGRDEASIGFGMNPEFLREGRAVYDFLHPDRIVIGSDDDRCAAVFHELYASFDAPKLVTTPTEAEMIKYTSNALLATKISFSNEIGNVCKKLGLDVYRVMEGVGLDTRIGPLFLNAGVGFGGSCFPKDVQALIHCAESVGEEPIILKSVMKVNDLQPQKMIDLLKTRIPSLSGKKIAVLGLAFKDNTDDIRESRSIPVINMLLQEKVLVTAYDPMAMDAMKKVFPEILYADTAETALSGADGALIMTEWPEFKGLESAFTLMRSRIIVDGRHMVSGEGVEGVCW